MLLDALLGKWRSTHSGAPVTIERSGDTYVVTITEAGQTGSGPATYGDGIMTVKWGMMDATIYYEASADRLVYNLMGSDEFVRVSR